MPGFHRRRDASRRSSNIHDSMITAASSCESTELVDIEASAHPQRRSQEECMHRSPAPFLRSKTVTDDVLHETKLKMFCCESLTHLKKIARQEIDTSLMGRMDEFRGNIYMILMFEDVKFGRYQGSGYKTRDAGFFTIWVVQMVGPPAIFLSTLFGWGIMGKDMYKWDHWRPDFQDWNHIALTKTLALFLIFGFCLNACYVIYDEHESWRRLVKLLSYMKKNVPTLEVKSEAWLAIGAFTNCWVVLWCCLDAIVVIGASMDPKCILFDSLGLLFVYNLDDIGGDFGFVSENDWPGDCLAWIYKNMVQNDEYEAQTTDDNDEEDDEDYVGCCTGQCFLFTPEMDALQRMVEVVYRTTKVILVFYVFLLPMFSSITSFTTILPTKN